MDQELSEPRIDQLAGTQPTGYPSYENRPSHYRARVALATGLTMVSLIGSQTLAILDRAANTKPVQIGHTTSTPTTSGTPKPATKPKNPATPAPSLNIEVVDSPTSQPKPSLNVSNSGSVQPAPRQPAPFSLSSRG